MNLLNTIKGFPAVCPLCSQDLSITLRLLTGLDNSYTYTLSNYEYPLIFDRKIPLGSGPETISINKDNTTNIPKDILGISSKISCNCDSYIVSLFATFLGALRDGNLVNIEIQPIERLFIKKYLIKNYYCNDHKKSYVIDYSDKLFFKQLISLPLKPITYWHFNNKTKFQEKINKLLLLA